MPYSGPSDASLPANVKALPDTKKRQWINVWNSVYQRCIDDGGDAKSCESKAFPQANGVVKMAEDDTLATETMPNVPLMRVGTGFRGIGCPEEGCTFTVDYLDQVADAYWATKGQLLPPVKLGHDENQTILQEDGLPAAGWVSNLRRLGDVLFGDLVDVPKAIGDLIRAGAYRTQSVELNENYTVNGQEYPKVLTGLALLGADLPAITGLGGITALYQKLDLKAADGATIILADINEPSNGKPGDEPDIQTEEVNSMSDLTEVRQALGLDEEGDVVAAITSLQAQVLTLTNTIKSDAPDKGEVVELRAELSEANQRIIALDNEKNSEMLQLRERVHNMEAAHRVDQAIAAGRVTPANRAIALKVALGQSEEDFNRFISALPRIDLTERGSAGAEFEAYEPTEAEISIAKQFGNWNEADPAGSRLALMRAKGAKIPAAK